MPRSLNEAAAVTQLVLPKYGSFDDGNNWSDPVLALKKGRSNCISTSLILNAQVPTSKIVRSSYIDDDGIETHFFCTKLSGRGYTPVVDRYAQIVQKGSPADHFAYWSRHVVPAEQGRSFAAKGPAMLARLICNPDLKKVEEVIGARGSKNALRLALIDPDALLEEVCGDEDSSLKTLAEEVDIYAQTIHSMV